MTPSAYTHTHTHGSDGSLFFFLFLKLHLLLFSRPFTCSLSRGLTIENTPPPLAQTPLSVVCSLHTSCARSPSFHSLSLLVRNCCTGVTGEAPRLSLLSASVLVSPDEHRLRATVVAPTWSWPLCVNVSIILSFIIQGLVCLLVCMTNLTPTGSLGSTPPWVRKGFAPCLRANDPCADWKTVLFISLESAGRFCPISLLVQQLRWLKLRILFPCGPRAPRAVDGEVSVPLALRSENEKACSHLPWVTQ